MSPAVVRGDADVPRTSVTHRKIGIPCSRAWRPPLVVFQIRAEGRSRRVRVCLCDSFFLHVSMDAGGFRVLAIANTVSVNVELQISFRGSAI